MIIFSFLIAKTSLFALKQFRTCEKSFMPSPINLITSGMPAHLSRKHFESLLTGKVWWFCWIHVCQNWKASADTLIWKLRLPQQSIVVFDIILVRLSFIESNDSLLIGVMVRLSLDVGLSLLTLLFFFSFHLSYGIIIYKR